MVCLSCIIIAESGAIMQCYGSYFIVSGLPKIRRNSQDVNKDDVLQDFE